MKNSKNAKNLSLTGSIEVRNHYYMADLRGLALESNLRILTVGILATVFCLVGCRWEPVKEKAVQKTETKIPVKSVSFYIQKLKDPSFVWDGPNSNGYVIPKLHAARALCYIGDSAVLALFDALEDKEITDLKSIQLALRDIGLPIHEYQHQLDERDTQGIRRWWEENHESSREARNTERQRSGLPINQANEH